MGFAENLVNIQARISAACERSGRAASEVSLVAVSKGHPPSAVEEAVAAGITLFGESKVQEAKAKVPLSPGRLKWHMIGHLQTNKCKDAVKCFDMIHSVDSLRLAEELEACCEKQAKTMPVLLEVNLAGESSKFGYRAAQLLDELSRLNALRHLEIHGLMTMAPWSPEPERARPVFRALRELKLQCEQSLDAPLQHLSMGMSGDFETAIEEGATLVRVGTALFGERRYARPAIED